MIFKPKILHWIDRLFIVSVGYFTFVIQEFSCKASKNSSMKDRVCHRSKAHYLVQLVVHYGWTS